MRLADASSIPCFYQSRLRLHCLIATQVNSSPVWEKFLWQKVLFLFAHTPEQGRACVATIEGDSLLQVRPELLGRTFFAAREGFVVEMVCSHCGSHEFVERGGVLVCLFCRATYEKGTRSGEADSSIGVKDDVERLLEKCRTDESRAPRYASLVLDIDPHNKEALLYL